MMMPKTIETKLWLHYMISSFEGTGCLEMYTFVEVLAALIVWTTNALLFLAEAEFDNVF